MLERSARVPCYLLSTRSDPDNSKTGFLSPVIVGLMEGKVSTQGAWEIVELKVRAHRIEIENAENQRVILLVRDLDT